MTLWVRNLPYYISLIFTAFPIYYAVTGVFPLSTLFYLAVFLLAYFYLIHRSGKSRLLDHVCLALMFAYFIYVTLVLSPQFLLFLFYISNVLIWEFEDTTTSPRFIFFMTLVSVLLVWCLLYPLSFENKIFLATMGLFGLGFTYSLAAGAERDRKEAERQQQNESINLLLAENERNRIGQDLHDTLGHVFAMLSVKSELALTLLDNGAEEQARKELAELHAITKSSMQEVRTIVQNLKEQKLADELQLIEHILSLAGVRLRVTGQESLADLTSAQEGMLAMILRELSTNLLKHSGAKQCQISFDRREGRLLVDFEDDGRGFASLTGQELHSIKERLLRQKGQVTILSQSQPTKIRLSLEMEEAK